MAQLKDPHHFASFINSSKDHITLAEVAEPQYLTVGRETEDEIGLSEIVKRMVWPEENQEGHGQMDTDLIVFYAQTKL